MVFKKPTKATKEGESSSEAKDNSDSLADNKKVENTGSRSSTSSGGKAKPSNSAPKLSFAEDEEEEEED